ncbi:MAG: alpha-E domain-containing protein [Proteobacteria bacterium]|nr:alpha-E domain-containing protein [Pseudomonadota bacterium]
MLSRTADHLYWMSRYVERAESLARLLEIGHRLAIMPGEDDRNEWSSTVIITRCAEDFYNSYDEANEANVTEFIGLRNDHPASIPVCLENARTNGRAVRVALTTSMWECLNSTWIDLPAQRQKAESASNIVDYLDWVKERSMQFTGATTSTMLRRDAYFFVMIGMLLERADNTASLLDVKYHLLLPDHEEIGGTLDFYQWSAILRAVTANRAYYSLYRGALKPWQIVEMLTLRSEVPRSLVGCLGGVIDYLGRLSDMYGERKESLRIANALYADLAYCRTDDVFKQGLHEFLTDFVRRNNELGEQIQRDYLI